MRLSPEDFFMYLTVALIIIIPVSVRVYRYLTRNRAAKLLREQFGQSASPERHHDHPS